MRGIRGGATDGSVIHHQPASIGDCFECQLTIASTPWRTHAADSSIDVAFRCNLCCTTTCWIGCSWHASKGWTGFRRQRTNSYVYVVLRRRVLGTPRIMEIIDQIAVHIDGACHGPTTGWQTST